MKVAPDFLLPREEVFSATESYNASVVARLTVSSLDDVSDVDGSVVGAEAVDGEVVGIWICGDMGGSVSGDEAGVSSYGVSEQTFSDGGLKASSLNVTSGCDRSRVEADVRCCGDEGRLDLCGNSGGSDVGRDVESLGSTSRVSVAADIRGCLPDEFSGVDGSNIDVVIMLGEREVGFWILCVVGSFEGVDEAR